MKSLLFSPIQIRELKIRNRIFVSPMCQYSGVEGLAQPWHLVHLGTRAVGGAGLVMVEATGVSPQGRISPGCLGLWNSSQTQALRPIARFIHEQGAIPAIQLAHAGRKASARTPLMGTGPLQDHEGAWARLSPSALPFQAGESSPLAMTDHQINQVVTEFVQAAERALQAGFQVIELHMAHGYLLHEFLSLLSNLRTDHFGGSLENRMRFPLTVFREVRSVVPAEYPIFVRISATDWAENGWDLEQSLVFCHELKKLGVDLIDVSTGGLVPYQQIPVAPGYQVPFASRIRQEIGVATGAVGLITQAVQAEKILESGQADAIFLARELLRNPYWPQQAAKELGSIAPWPWQYERGR